MDNIKVSVIIPVYNVEKYLRKCLDSVISQTYNNIEIIIVNDGSPDNSQIIIDEYKQKNSRIVSVYQENMGLSEARNTGMRYSSGYYYYFLDSDDYIKEDTIELLVNGSDDCDIVIANLIFIDDNGNEKYRPFVETQKLSNHTLVEANIKFDYFFDRAYGLNACNKLYKAEFIKIKGLRFQKNNEIYAEDLLFNLKYYVNQPNIKIIENYTYYYFQNDLSITRTFKPNLNSRFQNLINDFHNYLYEIKKLENNEDLIIFTLCIAYSNICQNVSINNKKNFNAIYNEIKEFTLKLNCINLQTKYIKLINKKSWKYFYLVFLFFCKRRMLSVAAFIQWLRFVNIK